MVLSCLSWLTSFTKRGTDRACVAPAFPLNITRAGVPRMPKLQVPLLGAQGYQRFPFSKPVVGHNIAVDAVPALLTGLLYQPGFCLPGSFNFIVSKRNAKSSTVECVLSSESELYMW